MIKDKKLNNLSQLTKILKCPKSNSKLKIVKKTNSKNDNFFYTNKTEEFYYPIIDGIPRFVAETNYADNFGTQWNHFRKTQLDSISNTSISSDRFFKATGWNSKNLKNKWVLDAGCGAGRFAEIALAAGAKVVALDYSSAVNAINKNLQPHPNLFILQADIYFMPFENNFFDYVYSLGVLQHTPNVEKAFKSLIPVLKPSGKICVDFYWKRFRTIMHSKYIFRPITKRIPQTLLFKFLEKNITKLLFISRMLSKIPYIGVALKRLIPVANYEGIFPLSKSQLEEWALLDTFDMLSPTYDKPQSKKNVLKFFKSSQLMDIEVFHSSHLVGRGIKK